jgi:hypothetical protein
MAARWTDEEEAVILANYETAPTVEHVAEMLGRTRASIIKKAISMGLKRPELHQASIDRLLDVLGAKPMSVAEVAAAMGITHHATNDLLRRNFDRGICHISGFRSCVGRGKDKPLWVAGKGENAITEHAKARAARDKRIAAEAARRPEAHRDPLQEALFGRVHSVPLSDLPRRIIRQSMTVTEDDLEVAA